MIDQKSLPAKFQPGAVSTQTSQHRNLVVRALEDLRVEATKTLSLRLAEQGDSWAQWDRAVAHELAEEWERAAYWYRKAAEQGDEWSQYDIGRLYKEGRGVKQDDAQAVFWFRKGADVGSADCQYELGMMYRDGRGVEQDDEAALVFLSKSAESGKATAQADVGLMYEKGWGVAKDEERAVYWYRRAAEKDHACAQVALSRMYCFGCGVAEDKDQASLWEIKAAELGNLEAQMSIGEVAEIYSEIEKALYWYGRAAEQHRHSAKLGDASSQYSLGKMYKEGKINKEADYANAMFWFQKAAAQGYTQAQVDVGVMYKNGYGVTQNLEKAEYWYRRAEQECDTDSVGRDFCWMFEFKDNQQAVNCYRKAAEQGDPWSQYELGRTYELGDCGVAVDIEQALYWYSKATQQDWKDADGAHRSLDSLLDDLLE